MKNLLKVNALWMIYFLLFTIQVERIQSAVSSCNARLRGASGTFTSPNYPDPPQPPKKSDSSTAFPDNRGFVTCAWEIVVPEGKGIQLKFGDFDMRAELDDCDRGEVEVFSGIGKTKSSLDKYCPGNTPDTVTLLNNTASVVFRRPSTFSGRGFLISFIAITPGETIDDFVTCSDIGQVHVDVESFSVMCPGGCAGITYHGVWGNLQYRDNSHLCQSAVHAGVISDAFGGRVTVRREPGDVLYIGTVANNITALTGAMSDFKIDFPDLSDCHEDIPLKENQFSASSFWNTTDKQGRVQEWLPHKAKLTDPSEAWSPGDPTKEQWLQVDLRTMMNVTGIVTTGSSKPYAYTRSFTIKWSVNNITWHRYKENNQRRPKVFVGNENFFAKVRNNFVQPIILARHIRVYPTSVKDDVYQRYGLKLGLTGCQSRVTATPRDSITPTPSGPVVTTTTSTRKTSTTTKTSTPATTVQPSVDSTASDSIENDPAHHFADNATTASSATNTTALIVADNNGDDTGPSVDVGGGSADLNERSIIIIAIVAALAVTSILLAALVLILVRKRKKDPKETMVPKPNSQTNATYNSGIDMRYLDCPSEDRTSKKDKKLKKKNKHKIEYKNENYKESCAQNGSSLDNSSINPRGGVTLMYDQQRQPLVDGDVLSKGSTVPVRMSYSANSEVVGPSIVLDRDTDSFPSDDDDDHEYQVIPDPVNDYNTHTPKTSSKASTGSSIGTHSKTSDTMPWQPGAVWGTAGDAWGKEPTSPSSHMTSFAPQSRSRQPQLGRAGTFSHPLHYSTNDDGGGPITSPGPPKTAPPCASFTAPRFSHRRRNGSQSPPNPSVTMATGQFGSYNPPQRYSSSSNGSSHSPFDMTSSPRHDASSPYYASVPETQENGLSNGDVRHPRHSPPISKQGHLGKKPSYKFPTSNTAEPLLFSAQSDVGMEPDYGVADPEIIRSNGGANGLSLRHSNSKLRSGYDHLYRNKTMAGPGGNTCVVAMTMNNYNQLDLNTAV